MEGLDAAVELEFLLDEFLATDLRNQCGDAEIDLSDPDVEGPVHIDVAPDLLDLEVHDPFDPRVVHAGCDVQDKAVVVPDTLDLEIRYPCGPLRVAGT